MSKLNKPDDLRKPLITKHDKLSWLRNIFSPGMPTSVSSGDTLLKKQTISVLNGDTLLKKQTAPEIATNNGNQCFEKGLYTEALKFYDRAIVLDPKNALYHRNRAVALWELGKHWEAVKECEQTLNLDPEPIRTCDVLAKMLLRLGHVDNARKNYVKKPSYDKLLVVLKNVETHLNKCAYARRHDEWYDVFSEASAAMVAGANFSPQLAMCKVEALLKLQRVHEAENVLAVLPKIEPFPASYSQTRFFDMISEAYIIFVRSQMYFALQRFDEAAEAIAKASEFDPHNIEVKIYKKIVKLIERALSNSKLEKWAEAVRDYESLSQALPCDKYISKSLFQAQVALRFTRDDV